VVFILVGLFAVSEIDGRAPVFGFGYDFDYRCACPCVFLAFIAAGFVAPAVSPQYLITPSAAIKWDFLLSILDL